ncbi:hypothetical protein TNIN_383131 [Trichonephila inaurata madagascariensis]|uniref:Uncharacterized protein n=1 Tax=Trichonephila inaurata madagascariensis TaxID=2747483 RepID=A0A8X6YFD4_9ARAC|nr:hypothetical protein TNIN_383131 [Trichonephila inaurata madagascariensis]
MGNFQRGQKHLLQPIKPYVLRPPQSQIKKAFFTLIALPKRLDSMVTSEAPKKLVSNNRVDSFRYCSLSIPRDKEDDQMKRRKKMNLSIIFFLYFCSKRLNELRHCAGQLRRRVANPSGTTEGLACAFFHITRAIYGLHAVRGQRFSRYFFPKMRDRKKKTNGIYSLFSGFSYLPVSKNS